MNYIKNIPAEALPQSNLECIVLAFIMSVGVQMDDNTISCKYKINDVKKHLWQLPNVEETLNSLEKKELIVLEDEWIVLGTWEEGKEFNLFVEKIEYTLEVPKELYKMYLSFSKEVSRGQKELLEDHYANVKNVFESNTYVDSKTAISFYQSVYFIVYQDTFRPFLQKEYGQIKTLLQLYKGKVLLKMFVHFLMETEKYGQTPSPGLVLFHKDLIYTRSKNLGVKDIPGKSKARF